MSLPSLQGLVACIFILFLLLLHFIIHNSCPAITQCIWLNCIQCEQKKRVHKPFHCYVLLLWQNEELTSTDTQSLLIAYQIWWSCALYLLLNMPSFVSHCCFSRMSKLEALRERRPPWPRQIITLILSTVKMLSLGCERLPTP